MDLLIFNTSNGGDLLLRGNALVMVDGLENTPYLELFGGSDWMFNYLVKNPYKSKTEEVLNKTPLTSAGRMLIEDTIKNDLAYLNDIPGTKYFVSVSITGPNRLSISIVINGQIFNANWNPDTKTLTMN